MCGKWKSISTGGNDDDEKRVFDDGTTFIMEIFCDIIRCAVCTHIHVERIY